MVLLAAANDDDKTIADGQHSFTKNLLHQFNECLRVIDQGPVSIRIFHDRLYKTAAAWRTSTRSNSIKHPLTFSPPECMNRDICLSILPRRSVVSMAKDQQDTAKKDLGKHANARTSGQREAPEKSTTTKPTRAAKAPSTQGDCPSVESPLQVMIPHPTVVAAGTSPIRHTGPSNHNAKSSAEIEAISRAENEAIYRAERGYRNSSSFW